MRATAAITILLAGAGHLAAPASAGAQVWKKVKQQAGRMVEARKAKADSTIVQTATGAVDSTLAPGSRALDAGSAKVVAVADTAADRAARRVVSALKGGGSNALPDRIAADLAGVGRATVHGLEFAPGAAELQPSSESALKALATVLKASQAAYLIEGHTDPSGDAAADQALSEQRAAAVKARLVALGIPSGRLFAMGYGATRPLGAGGAVTPGHSTADTAHQATGTAGAAKSVAEAVVPGARLIGLGAKALRGRRNQGQTGSAPGAAGAQRHARIDVARMR